MTLLDKLSEYRVFDLEWEDDHFVIVEGCDNNFGMDFTPKELVALANELIAAAKERDPDA